MLCRVLPFPHCRCVLPTFNLDKRSEISRSAKIDPFQVHISIPLQSCISPGASAVAGAALSSPYMGARQPLSKGSGSLSEVQHSDQTKDLAARPFNPRRFQRHPGVENEIYMICEALLSHPVHQPTLMSPYHNPEDRHGENLLHRDHIVLADIAHEITQSLPHVG
mmetsp:Transcript_40135/g.126235  ORF Transcript_40135/g.126235 Transcript_40135/m.126235 type:complete len:165 (+) Transcript_40135:1623-2117(+)